MNRRKFLKRTAAGLLIPAAPAIVTAANIMPVRSIRKANSVLRYGEIGVQEQLMDVIMRMDPEGTPLQTAQIDEWELDMSGIYLRDSLR